MSQTPAERRSVTLARIRDRQGQMAALIVEADRQWWRPFRARRLRRNALALHALNELDFEKLG